MKVSYVTSFYNGECEGRFGRFHDWVHELRDMDDPHFDFDIHAMMVANSDRTLATKPSEYLGSGDSLYGTKRNIPEQLLELPRILRGLRKSDPDIIHLVSFNPILFFAVSHVLNDKPLILGPNIGGWYPNRCDEFYLSNTNEFIKNKLKFKFRKELIKNLDYSHVVVFSKYHRDMLNYLGVNLANVTILHPGVSKIFSGKNQTSTLTPPFELLYVGDKSKRKGYSILLKALGRLDSDVNLKIVGTDSNGEAIIESNGISDKVFWEGYVPRSQLPNYYRSADLYIAPYLDEMGPNTIIEALACGTPVVATDSNGMNEYTAGDPVQYFWPRTADVLVETIEQSIEKIETLTNAAQKNTKQFRIDKTLIQLSNLYSNIIL